MDTKNLNRIFASVAFIVSLITYSLTVQPTVPFWDCGEFTAAAVQQQVPHPPGAPLFLMFGKIFDLLPIGSSSDPGIRVNMVSVVANAVTILLLYLTTVMVINAFRKKPLESMGEAIAVYGSALVGALAFNFSDTFWFNGVESEVYASSTLFVALVSYLMMLWWEKADTKGHERYLVLLFYVIGLSIGVHLLALLAIFSIVYLIYFRKYTYSHQGFAVTTVLSLVVFAVIYKFIVSYLPMLLAGNFGKNELREYCTQNSMLLTLFGIGIIAAGVVLVVRGIQTKNNILALVSSSFVLVIIGYTTYTHILIRANANPPMNENAPKKFNELLSYIGRDQYGEAPLWMPRRHEKQDEAKIRNYAKYGKWNPPVSKTVERCNGDQVQISDYGRLNYNAEFSYLWKYQINHMYIRYFLWNFWGRNSDIQDTKYPYISGEKASIVNFGNGFKNYFPVFFWGMPLLFGLIGMYFHVQRDPKMFWVYLSMFLMMGVLAAVAQNQQEPQPRERDYFYTGSFMVWCLWIGLGVYAIIDYIRKSLGDASLTTVAGGVTVVALIAVPVNMAAGGWKIHTRAGNYLPFDYSYNILQSCEKDAILFTNGDNDTFPLWYLQDVAGIRRDVRVVNLSLGNTLWYLDQLKNLEPWGAKKVPLTFSDESLRANENDPEALSYSFEPEKNISIPVDKALLAKYGADSATMSKGTMDFVFTGHAFREEQGKKMYIVQVQDKLILNILQNVKFTRPVYFSTTSGYPGSETFVGLSDFLRLEGMAYRICPTRQRGAMQGLSVDEKIMDQCLMQTVADDFASPEPKYGFKFRGLNNPDVYFDEHHRNYIDSYRRIFIQYAGYMAQSKRDAKKTVAILDKMVNSISLEQLEMDYLDLQNVADLYLSCGEAAKASKIGKYIVDLTQTVLDKPELRQQEPYLRTPEAYRYYHPALYQCDAYTVMGDEKAAKAALEKYKADVGSDPRALYRAESIGIRVLAAKGNAGEAFKKAQELYQRVPTMPNGMMLMQEASKLLSDMALASGNPNPVPPMMLGM